MCFTGESLERSWIARQPEIERGRRKDRGDRRQGPDAPPESEQHVHVLDSPPLEDPPQADQGGSDCDQRCRNLDDLQGGSGQARTVRIVPVTSTATHIRRGRGEAR